MRISFLFGIMWKWERKDGLPLQLQNPTRNSGLVQVVQLQDPPSTNKFPPCMGDGPKAKRPHTSPTNSPHKRLDIYWGSGRIPHACLNNQYKCKILQPKIHPVGFSLDNNQCSCTGQSERYYRQAHVLFVFLYINKSVIERWCFQMAKFRVTLSNDEL